MSEASISEGEINDRRWKLDLDVRRSHVDLLLISFLALFQELACIRWFGSTVVFLTFFTNLALMACFLGISVGCLAARRPRNFIESTIPLTLATMALAFGMLWCYSHFSEVMVDVGGQGTPDQIYFGTEFRRRDLAAFVIPLEAIAAVFFALISVCARSCCSMMRVCASTAENGSSSNSTAGSTASWSSRRAACSPATVMI